MATLYKETRLIETPYRSIVTLALFAGAVFCAPLPAEPVPHWIWRSEEEALPAATVFQRDFTSPEGVQRATLAGVADFCRMIVRLNGKTVAEGEAYSDPVFVDVTAAIRQGQNLLEVTAFGLEGPCALAIRLEVSPARGEEQVIVTDSTWSAASSGKDFHARRQPVDLGEVREFELDPHRQFGITALDDYEQWKQALQTESSTDPKSFLTLPGFEIELIRSATKEEGSWVSMAFDPRNRIVIGREDRGLLRMTLAEDGRSVQRVETVEDTLLECRGLLFAHGNLYANANNLKGFYRLRDSNGDDRFDDVHLLRSFEGGVGHGRNDLTIGPDGRIYSIHGDSVEIPRGVTDRTSPLREHRRGQETSEGHLLSADAAGRNWEVLAAGLRNPYGIAFNTDGEVFTYDADAEFDMGSPWYRPTQVKHLVAGADFGWRGVTGKWPPYYPDHPDNALPSVNIGKGSPTSVKFGYGSRFPADYREALYILDWAYGRIIAVHLSPRGASYAGRPESFLKGRPLNVTDLDFGPDGAMYFVTGGRKTQAGLYRVRYIGPDSPSRDVTAQQQRRHEHARASRKLRRELEARLDPAAKPEIALDAAWPHLDSNDPSIQFAARTVVELQPHSGWEQRALSETRPRASLAAMLALMRTGSATCLPQIVRRLNEMPLDTLSVSDLTAALYLYQGCLENKSSMFASDVSKAVARLDGLYPHRSREVNRYLSAILADQDSSSVVDKTISLLNGATDQAEQLHYLFVLRTVKAGWTPALREGYFDGLRRSASYLGGEGMPGFLRRIRQEFVDTMTAEERERYAAHLNSETATASDSGPQRPFVRQWAMTDLESVESASSGRGNTEKGRRLFSEALCGRCHRVGSHGQLAGPDLTGVSRRFSRRDILQSIVDPSLVVAENYRSDRIVTTDGRVLVGRIVQTGDFRLPIVRIVTDPLQPEKYSEIAKRDIESHETVPTSPMPAGLLNTLTQDEILDLLAFIESGGS